MRGRVVKAFGAAAVVAAGLAPVAEAAPPSVAGETVVVVERAAKMRITLPRRTKLALDPAKSVEVSGGGRLVGVVLRENHPQAEEAMILRTPAQLGARTYVWGPTAGMTGCTSEVPGVTPPDCSDAKAPTHLDLRRGSYTLYAFTDGAPARVTLRFDGYAGRTVLDPRTPVDAGSATYTTSVAAPASWSGGAAVRPEGPALLLSLGWWKQDKSVVAQTGSCWYDGSDGLPGPYKFLPGCPTGSSGSFLDARTPVSGQYPGSPTHGGQRGALGTSYANEAGTYGLGQWVVAQNVRDGGGFAYWLGR